MGHDPLANSISGTRRTAGLQQENKELRAGCAELHEARGLLDFIKTHGDPDRPPQ